MPMLSFFSRPSVFTAGIGLALALWQAPVSSEAAAASISSAQSGDWSAPSTWQGGAVPGPEDAVTIEHAVVYDLALSRVSGVTIAEAGELAFSPDESVTLETDRNLFKSGQARDAAGLAGDPASAALRRHR